MMKIRSVKQTIQKPRANKHVHKSSRSKRAVTVFGSRHRCPSPLFSKDRRRELMRIAIATFCLTALILLSPAASHAVTVYNGGGDLDQAGSWDSGLPSSSQDGLINSDGTLTAAFVGEFRRRHDDRPHCRRSRFWHERVQYARRDKYVQHVWREHHSGPVGSLSINLHSTSAAARSRLGLPLS